MMRPILMLAATVLGGCAGDMAAPVPPVNVTASDYCEIAEKQSWDVMDTPETIRGVRRENAKFDRRCRHNIVQR